MKLLRNLLLAAAILFAPSLSMAATPIVVAAATNTPVLLGAGAYNLAGYAAANNNAATVYVQFFDAASAGSVTVGTTPPKWVEPIPGGSPGGVTDGLQTVGVPFTNGVVMAVTTTPTGGTAPSSTVCISVLLN